MQLWGHKQKAAPSPGTNLQFSRGRYRVWFANVFCQPFLEFCNQHETVPDSLSEANIAPTSAQPIKYKIHCQIRHQPYQCNSKHFTVTSVWPITDCQHKKSMFRSRHLLFFRSRSNPSTLIGSQVTAYPMTSCQFEATARSSPAKCYLFSSDVWRSDSLGFTNVAMAWLRVLLAWLIV